MQEYQFEIHGVRVSFKTERPEIATSVESLLRPFRNEPGRGPAAFEIRLHGIRQREDLPNSSFSRRNEPSELASPDADSQTISPLQYEFYLERGQLVVNFYDWGLLQIDGPGHSAEGFLIRPESL